MSACLGINIKKQKHKKTASKKGSSRLFSSPKDKSKLISSVLTATPPVQPAITFIPFPLLDLPPLVLVYVLGRLSAKELLQFSETCVGLHRFCQHNAIWKKIAKSKWNFKPCIGVMRPIKWKHYYAQRCMITKEGAFQWQAQRPQGEPITKRYQHTGTVVGTSVYFIGGQELPEKRFDDIYVFRTQTNEINKVALRSGTPPKFARHTAVSIGQKIYTFGGFDGVSQHFHLFVYDTISNTWINPATNGTQPVSRTNHAAATIGDKMYLFGGMYKESLPFGERLVFLNDLFVLDSSTLTWHKLPQKGHVPSPRCGHRMVAMNGLLVLFGGGCGEQWDHKYSDVHVFNPETNEWLKPKLSGQAPVCTFTVTFTSGVFFFVFGGQSMQDNNLTNDLYCLDTTSMEWLKLTAANTAPGARDMASGNVVGANMYMFGGYCGAAIDTFYTLQMNINPIPEQSPSLFPID